MTQAQPQTLAATSGIDCDADLGAVIPPIYLSANYSFESFGKKRAFDYGRTDNPTRHQLAETLAALEGGAGAVVTASGMVAIDLVLSLLNPGDLVVAPNDCYGGTYRLLNARAGKGHFETAFLDFAGGEKLSALIKKPALVLIETPTNPLMRIIDIADVAAQAKQAGALLAVDNTFLSPARQKPVQLGADIVLHSTTKYINGHSDVIGGAVIAATGELHEKLAWWANCTGLTGAAFDSYLTLRGLRTLFVRIAAQEETAAAVAEFLRTHLKVSKVHYPGLAAHPQHALAKKQQNGFGAMLSFELKGGITEVERFVAQLKIFTLAQSLGGIESLIAHPASMTHLGMPAEARASAGITDSLLRLSIGLEAATDLIADLQAAFEKM